MLCNSLDSSIIVLTSYADSMIVPGYAYTRTNIVKLNLQGEILSNKKYKNSQTLNYISNIICMDNGGFMACGNAAISVQLPRAGWLFRFNSDGDSLWYRDYFYYPEDPVYGLNYLDDIAITSDNGFVSVGQAYTVYPPNNIQKMWVLKVDSVGCEIENCWVGIEEPGSGEAREQGSGEVGKQGGLVIWPNPVSGGVLSVKCLGLSSGISCSLSVFDIFGRLAPIPGPCPIRGKGDVVVWTIDVSSLPPGIYIAVVKDGNTVLESAKFVVAR